MTNLQYEGHYHNDSSGEDGEHKHMNGTRTHRLKSFDAIVFDVLKVPPDEFARQLTILDFPIFVSIKPDELTSCGWTKKEKWQLSPNVRKMTQRFNNTSFWVIREILNASTLKIRAEVLTHFIKIAKKLYELNNLHSLMAVIQSLNSSAIIRLSKTWAMLQKHHKATFDRLLTLVSEDGNRWELRSHMKDIKLPCIPFIGMYLSDIMYINSAHPDTGGLESHERTNKMNNILRVLAEFQQSKYDHLQEKRHIKNYLNNVKYIEELQKFLEEDNYKLSLKLEPSQSSTSYLTPDKKSSRSKENPLTGQNKSDNQLCRQSTPTPAMQQRFVPGHRKTRSLGKEFHYNGTVALTIKSDAAKMQKRRSWYGRSKRRDSGVGSSPTKGSMSPEDCSPSGSLPRECGSSSAVTLTTSLLDDSIIATPGSLASSSATKMTVTVGNGGSVGSSRSNSGSEVSEQDEMSWSSDRRFKHWSLPHKKSKAATKWFKVHHGSRGKYSLRAAKVQEDKRKSNTYPIERKIVPSSFRHSFIASQKLNRDTGEELSAESLSVNSDIDEFAKMRCFGKEHPGKPDLNMHDVTVDAGDVANLDYDVDDEEANLLTLECLSLKEKSKRSVVKVTSETAAQGSRSVDLIPGRRSNSLGSRERSRFSKRRSLSRKLSHSHHMLSCSESTLQGTGSLKSFSRSFVKAETEKERNPTSSYEFKIGTSDLSFDSFRSCRLEGCLKRKCVLKHGRKPTMSAWAKYWVCIYDTTLVYFAAKTLRGHQRHHFKSRPCKAVSVIGWMLLYSNDPSVANCFQLSNPENGNMYRFQCESHDLAMIWIKNLREAVKGYVQPERDLINLDDC